MTCSNGKAMNEVTLGVRGIALSPDSDCNSNLPGSASFLSNTSSQDIDFIQDNSDYQWFLDYGYRDNQHTSILSLGDSYEASDLGYYDAIAKNMDANLAEADMESFRTEDIHALLTNLPPMCTDHLSQENNRQGESFASVSGSIMAKFDFDSPHTSSQGEDSANSTTMSICKSELLFSPVKENPMLEANYSVDSLDCDLLNEHDIMLTCQANKDNYTIAFEGSVTMYSEDSDFHETDKSETSTDECPNWARKLKMLNHRLDRSMIKSDSSSLTTWSKLKKRSSENQLRRLPSGNNNVSSSENSCNFNDATMKSQSMPNLSKNKLRYRKKSSHSNFSNSTLDTCTIRKPVKVFDIQNQIQHTSTNGGSDFSDMATSVDGSSTSNSENSKQQQHFSLVKLFMKQKSMSAEGMSTALDHSSASENWPGTQSSDSNISDCKPTELSHSTNARNDIIVEDIENTLETKKDCPQTINNNNISERRDFKSRATNTKRNNSLGVSVSSESSNSSCTQSDNIRKFTRISKCVPLKLINKSMQTSVSELFKNPPYKLMNTSVAKEQVKIVEPSFLSKLKEKSEIAKPVYVLYPNYALPNLDFLNNKPDEIANVLLMPQNIKRADPKPRPFSCNDFETLKRKGFSHIQDWDSLNVLLPKEYKNILTDHFKSSKRNSAEYSFDKAGSSSSSSTQPSSGYRGSSTIFDNLDSQNSPATNFNPLFVYRYDSVSSETSFNAPPLPKRTISLDGASAGPPRPPLPRSILRKSIDNKRNKRYSLIDVPAEIPPENHDKNTDKTNKRLSLQDPYYIPRNKRLSETEDEGVDAGTSSSSFDEYEGPITGAEPTFGNFNGDDLRQLEEFLKLSGFSLGESETGDENVSQLRSYVGKFLSLRMNQDFRKVSFAKTAQKGSEGKFAPNNSPTVSAFLNQRQNQVKTLVDMPICEEGETSPETYSSPHSSPSHSKCDLSQKRSKIAAITDAVEQIIQHFSPATNQSQLNALGDSELNPSCAKLALTTLCPALYAALSDGLKPTLETSFGAIGNSVWQVVEASAQQGPLTKALNELVMRINAEDGVTEGLVKFNMFVFGLLNVRSLDAWMSYLRTRESIIKKHYEPNSLMVLGLTGSTMVRGLMDMLIEALQPLALLPIQFDLLFEYRQLHESLKRLESYHNLQSPVQDEKSNLNLLKSNLNLSKSKSRPRSCIDPTCYSKPSYKLQEDVTSIAKKRWSGVSLTSKLFQAYNRLAIDSEEEYTDSLETHQQQQVEEEVTNVENLPQDGPESLDSNISDEKPLNGRKFKKLQKKWEMLSGKEASPPESPVKSKIPRPVISPVKPSAIPLLKSPTGRLQKATVGGAMKKGCAGLVRNTPIKKNQNTTTTRTSRVDQVENTTPRVIPRPSSLPYKPATQGTKNSKITPPRRAASTSVTRKTTQTPKVVKTLSHRLPSESGHLPYNEGERLRVVLEVDDQWLLCCRGTQKGLVPRAAVIPDAGRF